jgi:hypothetical protein
MNAEQILSQFRASGVQTYYGRHQPADLRRPRWRLGDR